MGYMQDSTADTGRMRQLAALKANCEAAKKDLTGKVFGFLTAKVRHDGPSSTKNSEWKCICECGKEIVVRGSNLLSGQMKFCSRTCPMRGPRTMRMPDELVGQIFGQLKVLRRLPRPEGKRKAAIWECQCLLCGNLTEASGNVLRKGRKGSCGCAKTSRAVVRSDEVRKKMGDYVRKRYRADAVFAIEFRVRAQLRFHMKRSGISKTRRLETLLGYTMAELHARLLETMPASKSWDDFLAGGMEIDHIIGLENFNYTSEDDPSFREAWALSNLQLLTYEAHLQKSADATRLRTRQVASLV